MFHDPQTAFLDLNRLVKILKRKSLAMTQAVLDLGEVLADQIVRHVAIVASGRSVMRALPPAVILVSHDVTIHARRRIVREIAGSFGVVKRKYAHAEHNASAR